jgi:Na+-translocating ferredoxin:NAD+ oxidoreductase RnfD subunit
MTGKKKRDVRITALRRFAFAITLFNVLGHTLFGFEQSWAQPLVALLAAYSMELLLEWIDARSAERSPRFRGGFVNLFDFLLPAHISGMAVSMLLYANDRLLPVAFAAVVAMASKHVFRVAVGSGKRHFLNPSNFAITITLLLFPWVGIAQPYMFTENLDGIGDWVLPALIIVSGGFLNSTLTRKIPLIVGWLGAFALQATVRHLIFETPLTAALMPMTGVAFILFTFYMVTDPATTPRNAWSQLLFGAAVASGYGVLLVQHVVFGLFFSLTAVCTVRGVYLAVQAWMAERSSVVELRVPSPTAVVGA